MADIEKEFQAIEDAKQAILGAFGNAPGHELSNRTGMLWHVDDRGNLTLYDSQDICYECRVRKSWKSSCGKYTLFQVLWDYSVENIIVRNDKELNFEDRE